MSEIHIGDKIKGRVVVDIVGDHIAVIDNLLTPTMVYLHEIQDYKIRNHFLVMDLGDRIFEVETEEDFMKEKNNGNKND